VNWTEVRDDSSAVRIGRAAVRGSAILEAGRRLLIRFPLLAADVQCAERVDDSCWIAMAEQSWIARAAAASGAAAEQRARASATGRTMTAAWRSLVALVPADRIRAIATTLLVATMVHLTLSRKDIADAPPAVQLVWLVVVAASTFGVVAAPAIASAWSNRE
jgi:hypothetical protein